MNKEEQLMIKFRDLFNKMVWLNKYNMEASLKGYTPSEVHCVESIGKNIDPNVQKLAESLYMTRGAISKLTKRLIKKELIESYRKPDNKKEIYFRLTDQGKKVFKIHEEQHKAFQERDKVIFEQITEEQFDNMLHFLENYSNHLDTEIKRQGITIN
jgi:DNA-binding MarR family transcriptional regulator